MPKPITAPAMADEICRLAIALAGRAHEVRKPIQLAGSKEAAEILGVTPDRLYVLRHRQQLPKPIAELACGPIWLVEDLEGWQR